MSCCCGAIAGGYVAEMPSSVFDERTITDLVEQAGGNVNALFRTSMAWDSWSDIDLHMNEPTGGHIFYSHKRSDDTKGTLDVDMNISSQVHSSNSSSHAKPAVENIMYTDLATMPDGEYRASFVQYGVNAERGANSDEPYLLVEHRTPDEPKMSHWVLLKYIGGNQVANTSSQHEFATITKTGTAFALTHLPNNVKIVKAHNFNIGSYRVAGTATGSATENSATTGERQN